MDTHSIIKGVGLGTCWLVGWFAKRHPGINHKALGLPLNLILSGATTQLVSGGDLSFHAVTEALKMAAVVELGLAGAKTTKTIVKKKETAP